jgi:hypothetical protein
MRCFECKFFEKATDLGGLCRRWAPHPRVEWGGVTETDRNTFKPSWPGVFNGDWCGEFEEGRRP